jgi:predicted Ser/Thr protein kinase
MLWEADSVSWLEKVMPEADAETAANTVLVSGVEQAESRKRAQKKPGMTAFGINGNFCEANGGMIRFKN